MFRVAPTVRCYAPAREFTAQQEASDYAAAAAAKYKVAFAIWSIRNGRPHWVGTFAPARRRGPR
jgi:hypothetical protein